jgi:hypothetical protein
MLDMIIFNFTAILIALTVMLDMIIFNITAILIAVTSFTASLEQCPVAQP